MSILDGLRIDQSIYPGDMSYAHNAALDAVREALTSDATKRAIAADLCEHEGVDKACIDCTYKAELVQRLLAGGDQ